MTSKMESELRASACLTLEMIFLPIKLRVTAVRLCRASDTVFRREIDSQRQWGYGTCYSDSFPAAKECRVNEGGRKHVIFKVEQCAEHILSSN